LAPNSAKHFFDLQVNQILIYLLSVRCINHRGFSAFRLLGASFVVALVMGCEVPEELIQEPVEEIGLLGIGALPDGAVVPLGATLQFTALGYRSDLQTVNLTDIVNWQMLGHEILAVSSQLDREGLAVPLAPGQTLVRATYEDLISNEVRVTVTDAEVVELEVSPAQVALHPGESFQLAAEALFSDSSVGNATGSVRWLTANPSVARIQPGGRVEAVDAGWVEVRALYETSSVSIESDPLLVEVYAPQQPIEPPDLVVSSATASVEGTTVRWTVTVANEGASPASDIWIDAWLHREEPPPTPPTAGDAWTTLGVLDAGEQVQLTLELDDASPGDWTTWLLVDSMGIVDEGDLGEWNNGWGPQPVHIEEINETPTDSEEEAP